MKAQGQISDPDAKKLNLLDLSPGPDPINRFATRSGNKDQVRTVAPMPCVTWTLDINIPEPLMVSHHQLLNIIP